MTPYLVACGRPNFLCIGRWKIDCGRGQRQICSSDVFRVKEKPKVTLTHGTLGAVLLKIPESPREFVPTSSVLPRTPSLEVIVVIRPAGAETSLP